uniref:Retrovirus-related Pol polyprotein from transposon TNT 1-94-like beta-barrel domain-containing protein n=1 Tax=Tanacetum cinerariifolium TaxID=118510 RepID=A0A699H5K2_TANCI|nr:hypothetical protein [Tanacetum cinerariifolium]
MDQSNPTFAKILILNTGKFKQWKFRIQQYLQNEHYALWEIIELGDSYKAPPEEIGKGLAGESSARKKGRTLAITTEDMQKRRNDVKARTTLLFALPDEHQLRFSRYETAKELWEAILKKFGGNEATKKTKKNQLKLQYGNFKRNRDDLDTMSLDDVYNHLKVYEPEVQKKSGSNSQNMAFISSSNTSSGKSEVHTTSVLTASIQVSTACTDVTAASLSHDTICAYVATQSNGSQIKYEDITQIDEDDIKEIDIKWNMALFSMRADRAPRTQDRGKRESYKQGPKVEEPAPKELLAIDGIGWDWSYMTNEEENHALVADDEVPTEFAIMAKSSSSSDNVSLSQVEARLVEFKENEVNFCERIRVLERDVEIRDNKIEYLKNGLEQEGLGYSAVPPPPAQIYSPPKKDMSWTGLPEFIDDTVTDYRRPTSSSIMSKPMIKFVKKADCPRVIKINNTENARKSTVKYAEMFRNISKAHSNEKGLFKENQQLKINLEFQGFPLLLKKFPLLTQDFPLLSQLLLLIWETRKKLLRPQLVGFRDLNKILLNKDSDCSRHMTRDIAYLSEYEPYDGGYVSFVHGGEKITGKGIIKTGKLEFENVYFVKELKANCIESLTKDLELLKKEKGELETNLTSFQTASKDLDSLLKSQRLDKNKEGLGYSAVPPPPAQIYSPPKKDMSWIGLLEFADDTVTDYSRPSPAIETDCTEVKTNKVEAPRKSYVRYAEIYRRTSKSPNRVKRLKRELKARTPHTKIYKVDRGRSRCNIKFRGGLLGIKCSKSFPLLLMKIPLFTWTFFLRTKDEFSSILKNFITEIENLKDLKVKIISNARTPQQNGVAERRNRTLIEAARTMLTDAKLPVTFWVEAVNTACYVQNRILTTWGSLMLKGMKVILLENKLIEKGASPNWLFDIDTLTNSMNYVPVVVAGISSTNILGIVMHKMILKKNKIAMLMFLKAVISNLTATLKVPSADQVEAAVSLTVEFEILNSKRGTIFEVEDTFGDTTNAVTLNEVEADLSNMETSIPVSPTPTFRIHKGHPKSQIIGPVDTPVQTRHKSKDLEEQSFIATIHQKINLELLQFCLFSYFLSQEEPKKIFILSKTQVR